MKTEQFEVRDMSCQHCVRAITEAVAEVPGVSLVQVTLENKTVTVEHDDVVSADKIVAAINEAGYETVTRL